MEFRTKVRLLALTLGPSVAILGGLLIATWAARAAWAQAAAAGPPPTITITSRVAEGGVAHVKGVIEGADLKSAGIYEEGRCVKTFTMKPTVGPEKITLDLAIGNATPDTIIRVVDAEGRSAEAPLLDVAGSGAALNSLPVADAGLDASEVSGAAPSPPDMSIGPPSPPDMSIGPPPPPDTSGAVAEIPSHGPPLPSPSKRHTLGARLAEVRIEVLSVVEMEGTPPNFEIKGRIEGPGVTHAGIYVNGRLVAALPVSAGSSVNEFDQSFRLEGGSATIRAYGMGNQFVESPLDLTRPPGSAAQTAEAADGVGAPPAIAPGIAVEITSVQPAGANLYTASGEISGRGIESAGLYQNGALAQEINLGGMGGMTVNGERLGDLLGGIIPSRSKTINFKVRYNPASGPASIRAYAKDGRYTEQPLMVGRPNPRPLP